MSQRIRTLLSIAEDALFWVIDHRYWCRHSVKSAITGLAQVRGFRGATETRDDVTNRVHADLEYISNWTMTRDVSTILKTLRVIRHQNAS